jgi:hypothetical protein
VRLFNQYGVILVNPAKHPNVKKDLGQQFIDWLVSYEGQKAIATYKINGEQLFFPNTDDPNARSPKRFAEGAGAAGHRSHLREGWRGAARLTLDRERSMSARAALRDDFARRFKGVGVAARRALHWSIERHSTDPDDRRCHR